MRRRNSPPKREKEEKKKNKGAPPRIVLHSFGRFSVPSRGFWLPDVSPFAVSLETLLRMCRLPYELSTGVGPLGGGMSKRKGKIPWLEIGEETVEEKKETVEDTFFCEKAALAVTDGPLRFRMANCDAEEGRKAALHAAGSMVKNGLYWGMIYHRYRVVGLAHVYLAMASAQVPWWFAWFVTLFCRVTIGIVQLWGQGYGRHSAAEVEALNAADIRALDALLGDADYFGGAGPCAFDATAFAFLSGITEVWDSAEKRLVDENLPRLKGFVERVKKEYWPDWGVANNKDGWHPSV